MMLTAEQVASINSRGNCMFIVPSDQVNGWWVTNGHLMMKLDAGLIDGLIARPYKSRENAPNMDDLIAEISPRGVIHTYALNGIEVYGKRHPSLNDRAIFYQTSESRLAAFDLIYVDIILSLGLRICEISGGTNGMYGLTGHGGIDGLIMALAIGEDDSDTIDIPFDDPTPSASGED